MDRGSRVALAQARCRAQQAAQDLAVSLGDAGNQLAPTARKRIEAAKRELRKVFGKN